MFERLLDRLGISKKVQEAYCQVCGHNVTGQGGDVSGSGRIYCHGYKQGADDRCCDAELFIQLKRTGDSRMTCINYRNKRQVQSDIRKRRLKEYEPPQDLPDVPKLRTIASSR